MKRDVLVWEGELTPTPLSSTYAVKLRYSLKESPTVRVLSPALKIRGGEEEIPHLYPDGSLCLYYGKEQEWKRTQFLADTILPWASEYLAHYELWLATGEWLGGGVH